MLVCAQFILCFSAAHGMGRPEDLGEAVKWLEIAARLGKVTVRELAAKMRNDISLRMTRQQIAEAGRLAREWLRKYKARKK